MGASSRRPTSCGCRPANWKRRGIVLFAAVTFLSGGVLLALRAPVPRTAGGAAEAGSCAPFGHRHAAWTAILRRHVRDGTVDYAGLGRHGSARFSAYLRSLASVCPETYAPWTRRERLAFWINTYNAYTVRLILDHYPIGSIREVGLLPGAAFATAFIPMQALVGRELSLNDVEHEILRKEFQEPRNHFAIVCASKSCPVLRSEAYRPADLERQLDEQARRFIGDPEKNRFDPASRTLYLSSIFMWFREDFEHAAGTLVEYVARYVDEPTAAALHEPGVRIEFLDYDWSLNGR